MTTPPDDRLAVARAYDRATQIVAVAIGMAAPPLAGHFLDDRFGTRVVFTILGAAFGLTYGIWHLLKLADPKRSEANKDSSKADHNSKQDDNSQPDAS